MSGLQINTLICSEIRHSMRMFQGLASRVMTTSRGFVPWPRMKRGYSAQFNTFAGIRNRSVLPIGPRYPVPTFPAPVDAMLSTFTFTMRVRNII